MLKFVSWNVSVVSKKNFRRTTTATKLTGLCLLLCHGNVYNIQGRLPELIVFKIVHSFSATSTTPPFNPPAIFLELQIPGTDFHDVISTWRSKYCMVLLNLATNCFSFSEPCNWWECQTEESFTFMTRRWGTSIMVSLILQNIWICTVVKMKTNNCRRPRLVAAAMGRFYSLYALN